MREKWCNSWRRWRSSGGFILRVKTSGGLYEDQERSQIGGWRSYRMMEARKARVKSKAWGLSWRRSVMGSWSLRRKERKGWRRRGTFGSRAGEVEEESSPLHNCVPERVVTFKLLHFKQFRPNCFSFFHSPTQPLVTSLVAVSMRKDFCAPEKPALN